MEGKDNGKQKRKGKKKMIGWIIALVVVVAAAIGIGAIFCSPSSALNKEHAEAKNLPIASIDFSKLSDGIYLGEYEGGMYKWRVNQVQVTVSKGKVTEIKPLGTDDPKKKYTERDTMYDRVLKAQSLQVDVVSGATLTSKAYLKGLEAALVKGEK